MNGLSAPEKPMIALTGSTGFIGRYLLRELPRRGYRLRILLRRPAAIPAECTSAVVGDLAWPQNMAAALADVDAVIHTAGLSHTMSGLPELDYRLLNTEATIGLARAAQRAGVKRFVLLSSLRAQCGPVSESVLTEDLPANPTDAYGRSKLAAEQGLAELTIDWVALRLALVYGPGVTGNMARLMGLARSPLPLPLGGLTARRSLLSLENLTAGIVCVLETRDPLRRPLIIADPEPLTIAEMIAALRQGLARRPFLVALPRWLLKAALRSAGHPEIYRLLVGPLVADPRALTGLGWRPTVATRAALAALMRDHELDASLEGSAMRSPLRPV